MAMLNNQRVYSSWFILLFLIIRQHHWRNRPKQLLAYQRCWQHQSPLQLHGSIFPSCQDTLFQTKRPDRKDFSKGVVGPQSVPEVDHYWSGIFRISLLCYLKFSCAYWGKFTSPHVVVVNGKCPNPLVEPQISRGHRFANTPIFICKVTGFQWFQVQQTLPVRVTGIAALFRVSDGAAFTKTTWSSKGVATPGVEHPEKNLTFPAKCDSMKRIPPATLSKNTFI